MRDRLMLDLSECTEFRQTLLARPPRIVHGTVILLVSLLGSALIWSALTSADLVVRATGRIRPLSSPMKVVNTAPGGTLGTSSGGRVVAVYFREGNEVRQGDVLIRLDTERLDNEIAKRKGIIQTTEEELAKLDRLEELSAGQFEEARAKAQAELQQVLEEVTQAKRRQMADIRLAQLEVDAAADEAGRLRRLVTNRAAAPADLVKATTRLGEAREKLARAQLPVEEAKVEVLRRALAQTKKDYAVKREELALRRSGKQGEVKTARVELTSLELERGQTFLRAPVTGVVTTGDVKVGDVLEPGKPAVEIAEQKGFHFEVTVPSGEVAHLRAGMPARVRLDAYDYEKYGTVDGTVVFVSPDSSVPDGQRPAGYLVRIALESDEVGHGEFRGRVKLGMTGQVDIVTEQESLLALLLKKVRRTISLE